MMIIIIIYVVVNNYIININFYFVNIFFVSKKTPKKKNNLNSRQYIDLFYFQYIKKFEIQSKKLLKFFEKF